MTSPGEGMEVFSEPPPDKTLKFLNDYLRSNSAFPLAYTAKSILDVFPENGADSEEGPETAQYIRYRQLGYSLRSGYYMRENPRDFVNFHAFAANLVAWRIIPVNPTWAIWAQRDAHEELQDEDHLIRDAHVMAAALWILLSGQRLFQQVQFLGQIDDDDLRSWRPGPLYSNDDDDARLTLQRWRFWRDGFSTVASGEKQGKTFSEECRNLALKAADMMDAFEKNMSY
ncbi:MAG: hypothetical protein M1825_004874 [Sarcosagium campestre]|nr:MAG: hypothetical protein M1825_004874 [Sarcosagium campestre]